MPVECVSGHLRNWIEVSLIQALLETPGGQQGCSGRTTGLVFGQVPSGFQATASESERVSWGYPLDASEMGEDCCSQTL